MHFRITTDPIDTEAQRRLLGDARCGAYAAFEGWVRNHHAGRNVLGLNYACYPQLAEHEGQRILGEAHARFDIHDAACIHRIGNCAIADLAVWVGVTAIHRDAAFAACQWIIDAVKLRLPIWKQEYYADGTPIWREG